jgi:hypothetical protein
MFYEPDKRNHGLKYNPLKALDRAAPDRLDFDVGSEGQPNPPLQPVQPGRERAGSASRLLRACAMIAARRTAATGWKKDWRLR